MPSDFVVKQIDACIGDIGVDVIKIGMLASASTVDAVADALKKHGKSPIVLDPVMVATSGAQLLPNEAIRNLRLTLLPLTTILTPNVPEARLLLQDAGIKVPDVNSVDDLVNIALLVQGLGPRYVLVKGGHLPLAKDGRISKSQADSHTVVDVLSDGCKTTVYETKYLPSKNTHGTGCSLACKLSPKVYSPSTLVPRQLLLALAMCFRRYNQMRSHTLYYLTSIIPLIIISAFMFSEDRSRCFTAPPPRVSICEGWG